MRRSHDRYNDVEPSSPPQCSPDYTIVIRGYNFREGQALIGSSCTSALGQEHTLPGGLNKSIVMLPHWDVLLERAEKPLRGLQIDRVEALCKAMVHR